MKKCVGSILSEELLLAFHCSNYLWCHENKNTKECHAVGWSVQQLLCVSLSCCLCVLPCLSARRCGHLLLILWGGCCNCWHQSVIRGLYTLYWPGSFCHSSPHRFIAIVAALRPFCDTFALDSVLAHLAPFFARVFGIPICQLPQISVTCLLTLRRHYPDSTNQNILDDAAILDAGQSMKWKT